MVVGEYWTNAFCWFDQLPKGGVLRDKFRRLFDLADNKFVMVAKMCFGCRGR